MYVCMYACMYVRMYVCMHVSTRFTVGVYVVQAPHCHVHTQCDKDNDKQGEPVNLVYDGENM